MRSKSCVIAAVGLCLACGEAFARSSIGIGTSDAMAAPTGPFAGFLAILILYQREFFDALRHALVAMRTEPGGFGYLVGLSFIYGIFHAAGPGHGKAVISSYMVANEVQLRRGIILSFASAILQAASAIVVVGVSWYFLRGTRVSMTDATDTLELASFCLVALFGAVLLVRKIASVVRRRRSSLNLAFEQGLALARPIALPHGFGGGASSAAALEPMRLRYVASNAAAVSSASVKASSFKPASAGFNADICRADDPDDCGCGKQHMVDPARLTGKRMSLGTFTSIVASTGLRPCAGAIVVLTFALLNSLYLGGLLSVFAMSLGTAITVSVLASVAVFGKNLALKASGNGRIAGIVSDVAGIGGAVVILLMGLMLIAASLQGG